MQVKERRVVLSREGHLCNFRKGNNGIKNNGGAGRVYGGGGRICRIKI